MPKHRRDIPAPPPSTGILAGVLNFVAREFDSFVASATGTYPAGPSHAVNDDAESDGYDSQDAESDDPSPPRKRTRTQRSSAARRRSASSLEPLAKQSRKRKEHSSEEEDEGSHSKPTSRRRKERGDSIYPSIDTLRAEESAHANQGSQDESDDAPRPSSPTSLPLAAILKRKPSMTMPGSLFPRSPSLEPEAAAANSEHRVRFSSARCGPSKSRLHQSSTLHDPDSPSPSSSPSPPTTPSRRHSHEEPVTPSRRQHLSSGIKSAVDKFHEDDADPSILLPSPQTSPVAKGTTQYLHSPHSSHGHGDSDLAKVDKGKGRAIDPDSSGMLRVMGKEQELVAARARLDRNLQTREDEGVNEQTFILEQAEKDREADRERIRMLEQEIEWLKGELSKRPSGPIHIDITPHPAPPPPPPPPPPKTIITIPSVITDPNLYASARASLNHAPTPVEKPILQPRKTGISTVGLPPEKMAAFLTEMKTVRLRKTANGDRAGSGFGADSAANATFTAHTPASRVSDTLPPRRSYSLQRPAMTASLVDPTPISSMSSRLPFKTTSVVGEKRKRSMTTTEDPRAPRNKVGESMLKRTSTTTAGSQNQSFESTSASNTSSQSILNEDVASSSLPPPRSQKPASQSTLPTQPRQPSSVTTAPTPSLCSDNEAEREGEGEASLDDKLLSTPPLLDQSFNQSFLGPSRSFYRFRGNGIPVESDASDREKERRASLPLAKATKLPHAGDISRRKLPSPAPGPKRYHQSTIVEAVATDAVTFTSTTTIPVREKAIRTTATTNTNKSASLNKNSNVFAKRTPASPMPEKSPRRPRIPSRNSSSNSAPSQAQTHAKPPSKPRPPTPPRRRSRPQDEDHSDGDSEEEDLDAPLTAVYANPAAGMVYASSSSDSNDVGGNIRDGKDKDGDERGAKASGTAAKATPGPSKSKSKPRTVAVRKAREVSPTPLTARVARATASSSRAGSQREPDREGREQRVKQAARRRTLDEELRSAVPFLHDDGQEDDGEGEEQEEEGDDQPHGEYDEEEGDDGDEDLHYTNADYHEENDPYGAESGVLVDVGVRSTRRGFLARGGAGGSPVFMGVGYVEGAEDDEEEEEEPEPVATPLETKSKNRAPRRSRPAPPTDDDDDEYIPSPPPRTNRTTRR